MGAQLLAVGAGAGVLGGVLCDLRRLQTQVLAAAVGHTAQVTAVWAWEGTTRRADVFLWSLTGRRGLTVHRVEGLTPQGGVPSGGECLMLG